MPLNQEESARYQLLLQKAMERGESNESVYSGKLAVELAERSGEPDKIFDAKSAYMLALIFAGEPEKAFPHMLSLIHI